MVTFYATNSDDVNMSYRMFGILRDGLATKLDRDFGMLYKNDVNIPKQMTNRIDIDILDFLMQSDIQGEIGYKVCKKVLNELQAVEFNGKNKEHIDRMKERLCEMLQECYSHRRKLRWN